MLIDKDRYILGYDTPGGMGTHRNKCQKQTAFFYLLRYTILRKKEKTSSGEGLKPTDSANTN